MRRRTDASERYLERRRREDEAPRLIDVVPDLRSCKLEIEERRVGASTVDVKHTRHIVVGRAPALFVIACGDPACRDGGYDITYELLRGLKTGAKEVHVHDACHGQTGTANCGRELDCTAFADYGPPDASD